MTRLTPAARIDHLVVARESNARDLPLLEGMIVQTHERYDLPGRQQLMDLGVRPVTHPNEVGAEVLRRHGSKAVLFAVDGTACLYSQGSAAKDENTERDNGFVEILCKVIERHQPRNVYVATFSRLVRSFYHASPVHRALENAESTLHYSEGQPINFGLAGAALHWSVMAAFADMERKAIVTRLMLGRIGKHRQGKWIQGSAAIPMGYTLDSDRRLVVDTRTGVAQAVHKAIRLMGDREVGLRELGIALGAIGVSPPRRTRGSEWGYDPAWSWNGQAYVPRARRDEDDEVHALHAITNRARSQPRNLTEHAYPELVARRLVASLDLWQTGRVTITYGNAIRGVKRYAEYPTVTSEDGTSRVEFPYDPGTPEGGWATEEEFAQARAVRSVLSSVDSSRAHALDRQMPLLGNLGRWQDETNRYALLSSHSTRTKRYELRSLPLLDPEPSHPGSTSMGHTSGHDLADLHNRPDDLDISDSATFTYEDLLDAHQSGPTDDPNDQPSQRAGANRSTATPPDRSGASTAAGTVDGPQVFARRGHYFGERLAKVDADDLHKAIVDALTEALESGVHFEPHPQYPPLRIDPVGTVRRDALRVEVAATEERVRNATNILLGDLDTHIREHVETELGLALAEQRRLRAETETAAAHPAAVTPTDLLAHPQQIAAALAVLRNMNRPTPRRVTEAINTILSDLRLTPDGPTVHGTIKANLPVEDGLVVLGPVHFELPQRMGSRTTGKRSIDRETAEVRDNRYRDIVQQLLTTSLPLADIADSQSLSGSSDRRRALDWMHRQGMHPKSARQALACAVPEGRAAVWALLTNQAGPDQLDPAFLERMRQVYFEENLGSNVWYRPTGMRAELTALIRENGGPITIERVKQCLQASGNAKSRYKTIFNPPRERQDRPLAAKMLPSLVVAWRIDRTFCDDDCPPRCWEHRPVSLRECPHCDGLLDHHIPVLEIATGMLCGTCLREPTDDSPVFPATYLAITKDVADRRADDLNPHRNDKRHLVAGTRTIRENAIAWARRTGRLKPGHGNKANATLINAYLDAVGRNEVQDTMVIRHWARDNGVPVNARGKLPERAITAYRRHLADEYPQLARVWARTQGYRVPRTGDLSGDIIDAFAEHRPE